MAGKSAAQTRNQNVLDIVLRLQYDRGSNAGIEEMKKEIARHQKLMPDQAMRFSVGKDNLSMAKKAGDKTGKAYKDGMTAGFYGGGGKSGFGKSFAMDDFTMKSQQMRGVTTGLRHEVGKLRNTLLLVAFATAGIVSQFKAWFNVVLQTEAAMTGLRAVAIGTGIAFQQLKNYSEELEDKGFLSLRGSAAAQKNLAASHLSLSEVKAVVSALTDAAAFNRQGTLSMEEAIVGATQGIKNQNSIMIDNAGITKNVSIMYREFAISIGKTAGALTEQEKRQAITNGILKEAALFAGNAAKSMDTYQGKITKLNTMLLKTQRELGNIVATEVIQGLEALANNMSSVGESDSLKVFVELIAKLTKNMMVLVTHFTSLGEGFSGAIGGGVGKALTSINAQFTIMALLILKVGRYISALGAKAKINSAAFVMHNKMAEKSLLNQAVIMKQGIVVKGRTRIRNAIEFAKVADITNNIIAKGTAQQEIQVAVQNRLQELYVMQNRSLSQNLEYHLLINQANMAGLKVVENAAYMHNMKKGAFTPYKAKPGTMIDRKRSGGKQRYMPVSTFQDLQPQAPNIKVVTADTELAGKHEWAKGNVAVSETAKIAMGNMQRLGYEVKQLGSNFRIAGRAAVMFFANITKGGKKAIFATNTLKAALRGVQSAFKGITSVMFNMLTKFFMWYTVITLVMDVYKDLFHKEQVASKERQKAIQLETIALGGLNTKYSEVVATLDARSEVFNTESRLDKNFNYDDIIHKSGKSIAILKQDLGSYLKEITRLNDVLKNDNLLKVDFDETMEKIEEFKTYYTNTYNKITEVNDAFNKSLETLGKNIKDMVGRFSMDVTPLVKNVEKYAKVQKDLITNRKYFETLEVSDEDARVLGLPQDESNAFYAGMKANELSYQMERVKIVQKNEKIVTNVIKKANEERLKIVSDSSLKQLFALKKGYDNSIKELERSLKTIEERIRTAKISESFASMNIDFSLLGIEASMKSGVLDIDSQIKRGHKYFLESLKTMDAQLAKEIRDMTSESKVADALADYESARKWTATLKGMTLESPDNTKFETNYQKWINITEERRRKHEELVGLRDGNEDLDRYTGLMSFLDTVIGNNGTMLDINDKLTTAITEGGSLDPKEVKGYLEETANTLRMIDEFNLKPQDALFNKAYNKMNDDGLSVRNLVEKISMNAGVLNKALTGLLGSADQTMILKDGRVKLTKEFTATINSMMKIADETTVALTEMVDNQKKGIKNMVDDLTYGDALTNAMNTTYDAMSGRTGVSTIDSFMSAENSIALKEIENRRSINRTWNQLIKDFKLEGAEKAEFNTLRHRLLDFEDVKVKLAIQQYWGNLGKTYAEEAAKFNRETRIKVTEVDIIPTALGLDVGHRDLLSANYYLEWNKAGVELGLLSKEFTKFEAAAYDKYWADMTKSIIEDTKEMTSAIMDGAFDMGKTLGDNFFKGIKVIKVSEQEAMKDMNEIFKQGEITEAERLDRKLQIHQYYASSMTYMWHNTAVDIGTSMIEMVQEVVKQSAIAIAAQNAVNAKTGNLGDILGAALGGAVPILGAVSIGLGLLTSAVSSRKIEQGQLEFESDTQNDMSKFGGTIKAEDVEINISPTFIIEGNQVFIGSGSVVEYVEEATELMKSGIQQSIDNKEFDLNAVKTAS